MKYLIEITETYQRTIEVEAPSKVEALKTAEKLHIDNKIILDDSDYVLTSYKEKEE